MKMKNKAIRCCFAMVMTLGVITTVSAARGSVNAGICGTMNYGNVPFNGNEVHVYTNISRPNSASRVRTTTKVEDNVTGAILVDITRTSAFGGNNADYFYTNHGNRTLACFGAHSVQGRYNKVVYTVSTF